MFNKKKCDEVVDFRTNEQKKEDFKMAVKQKWNGFADWVRDNQDVLVIAVPAGIAVLGAATKVTTKALRAYAVNREVTFKECTIYDRSLGRYIQLKKPLTTQQALEVEARRQSGEKLTVILQDMNLLK